MPRKINNAKHQLARAGDPLVLADGMEIGPETDGQEDDQPTAQLNSRTFKPTKKRTLKELPTKPMMINAIACAFMYTVLGVGDREIALALNITSQELIAVRKHPAYQECFEAVLDQFISVNSSLLQARLAAYGMTAVDNIIDIAATAKKDEVRLSANKDIADRAGISAKTQQANSRVTLNDLHITITKGEQTDDVHVQIGGREEEHV